LTLFSWIVKVVFVTNQTVLTHWNNEIINIFNFLELSWEYFEYTVEEELKFTST